MLFPFAFHYLMFSLASLGFPGGSVGKENACSAADAGDMGLSPELGRSPGGRHGNHTGILARKISRAEELDGL